MSDRGPVARRRGAAHPVSVLIACVVMALLIPLATVLTLQPARAMPTAPTFTVNSNSDVAAAAPLDNCICETAPGNGVCTLRAAITKANNCPGGGVTINFGLPGTVTYGLTGGALVITSTMTISGSGAENTIIDGNATDRVFTINVPIPTPTPSPTPMIAISGVTITNGKQSGLNAFGGAILSNNALTLTNSIVSNSSTNSTSGGPYGGGIYSSSTLTLVNSSVTNNAANTASGIAAGGGIIPGFALTVTSTISGNTAHDSGGERLGRLEQTVSAWQLAHQNRRTRSSRVAPISASKKSPLGTRKVAALKSATL